MGTTNLQCTVNTLKLAFEMKQSTVLEIGRVNTGTYTYVIRCVYDTNSNSLTYEVFKYGKTGWLAGEVHNIYASAHGVEFHSQLKIPESVIKKIHNFHKLATN